MLKRSCFNSLQLFWVKSAVLSNKSAATHTGTEINYN